MELQWLEYEWMTGYRPVLHFYSSSTFQSASTVLMLMNFFSRFFFAVLCLVPWFHKMIIVRGEGTCVHNVMYAANTERERPPSHYREKGTRAPRRTRPALHCLRMTHSILVTGDVSSSNP